MGPREEGIKGSHVGPAFISRLQRGANKLCPRARRQRLPPWGPSLLFPPPFCFFPESQQLLILGHPRGAATPGLAGGKGRPCQAEGRKGLGPSHLCTYACSHRGPGWELDADASRPSDLSRAFPSRARCPVSGHTWLSSTRYVASPKGDVPEAFLQIQPEQKHVKYLI